MNQSNITSTRSMAEKSKRHPGKVCDPLDNKDSLHLVEDLKRAFLGEEEVDVLAYIISMCQCCLCKYSHCLRRVTQVMHYGFKFSSTALN